MNNSKFKNQATEMSMYMWPSYYKHYIIDVTACTVSDGKFFNPPLDVSHAFQNPATSLCANSTRNTIRKGKVVYYLGPTDTLYNLPLPLQFCFCQFVFWCPNWILVDVHNLLNYETKNIPFVYACVVLKCYSQILWGGSAENFKFCLFCIDLVANW